MRDAEVKVDGPLALQGLLWGLLSAVSLPLGAALGLWRPPPKRVTAALMAFGGGALLFALTIELFGHALHAASEGGGKITLPGIALAAMAAGAVGGVLFQTLNRMAAPFETVERVGLSQYKVARADGTAVFIVWEDGRPLTDQIATQRVKVTGIDGKERTMDLKQFEAGEEPVFVEPMA